MNTSDIVRERARFGIPADRQQAYGLEFGQSYPALVASQDGIPGTDGGAASVGIKIDQNGSEGFSRGLGHEVLHYMLSNSTVRDHHSLRGMLGRPMSNSNINRDILNELKISVPRASTLDRVIR